MSIILSVLLAFTQLSVSRPASGVVAAVVPASGLGLSSQTDPNPPGPAADSGLAPAAPVRQFTWNLQATLPSTVLIDLSFADDSVGYACAELGIVYKTTNAGATWSPIMNLGFPYYWYGVSAVTRQTAIVTGFNNTAGTGIYRWTTDGGSSWDSIVTLDTANWLSRAHFADSLHGIISAGWNGGRNPSDWNYVQIDPTRGWFEGNFCYRTDGHCWLTGINFCASADHGLFWDVQHSADPVFDGGVWFSDTLHGWTGGGQISAPVSGCGLSGTLTVILDLVVMGGYCWTWPEWREWWFPLLRITSLSAGIDVETCSSPMATAGAFSACFVSIHRIAALSFWPIVS